LFYTQETVIVIHNMYTLRGDRSSTLPMPLSVSLKIPLERRRE
jgi:hypothetical protein